MATPNLFLIYVTDIQRATAFYSDLFGMEPIMVTPRYIPFQAGPGVIFALWNARPEHAVPATPRTSEVGLTVHGGAQEIDRMFAEWSAKATVVEEPYDEVFGRTFVVADPDGNLIRVSPVD